MIKNKNVVRQIAAALLAVAVMMVMAGCATEIDDSATEGVTPQKTTDKFHLDFSDVHFRAGYYIKDVTDTNDHTWFDEELMEFVVDYIEDIEFIPAPTAPDEEYFREAVVLSYFASDEIPLSSTIMIVWDGDNRAWNYDPGRGWSCDAEKIEKLWKEAGNEQRKAD